MQFKQAIEVKNECDRVQVQITAGMLSTLLSLWIGTNDEKKAFDVWDTLQTEHLYFEISAYKIVKLATLLLSKDRLNDAKLVIESLELRENEIVSLGHMWHLLKTASDYSLKNHLKENLSEQFLNILLAKGHCDHINELTGLAIQEYIDKNEIDKAVNAFEYYVNESKKTPRNGMLLRHLIKSWENENVPVFGVSKEKASEYIVRVTNLIKSVHGIESANAQLIVAFACAGNKYELQRILTNPLVKFNSDNVLDTLIFFKDKTRIDAAVMIGRCVRGLNHTTISEENLYEFILNDYVRTDDYCMALEFYKEIKKDKDSFISNRFCEILAKLLIKNEQPLPDQLE